MIVCVFLGRTCTRDRGCAVHPAFPRSLCLEGREINGKPRAEHAARMRSHVSVSFPCLNVIARSSCDEAIHSCFPCVLRDGLLRCARDEGRCMRACSSPLPPARPLSRGGEGPGVGG